MMNRAVFGVLIFAFLSARTICQDKPGIPENVSQTAKPHVTITEFADFQCPYCARQAADLRKLQTEYAGRVTVVFRNFPLSFHTRAKAAHRAALAAQEQGKFWEMHDLIYSRPGHLTETDFEFYADQLGLDTQEFLRAMADRTVDAAIESDIAEGKALGISATPTFVIQGRKLVGRQTYSALERIVEAELRGEPWEAMGARQQTEQLEVDTKGSPSRGSETSEATIVEFSDFQCPFCARAAPALMQLLEENAGDLRWVFKNFPLDFHRDSQLAHLAALAAGEQGKFWEMHDLIFEHQKAIKRDNLLNFASQLGLDKAQFQRDLDNPKLKEKIEADRNEGRRLGVSGTPTFLVNGQFISGFSTSQFESMISNNAAKQTRSTQAHAGAQPPSLDLSLGPRDAPIKIEWYDDLSSPLTARSAVAVQEFMSTHPGAVNVQFRNFPLPNRKDSTLVHEFALAAAGQGKFWSTVTLLLADKKPKDRNELRLLAAEAGLDQSRLWAEINAKRYMANISSDLRRGGTLGVRGTPTFVVGAKKLDGVNGLRMLDTQ
jgi:protein-disulfide isomerase